VNPGEETTSRIRWEPTKYGGWTGHVGTLEPWLFQIHKPGPPCPAAWELTTALPGGLGRYAFRDDPEWLKAEAERWLAGFVSSLGAVFPEAAALPPVGPDGMRDLTCGACGGEFGTNFREEEIECAYCDARRCPSCGEWFGGDL
jgi:hypothetical protein